MQVVKCVKQNYVATSEILSLLEEFRKMINDCVRIGLEENVTSRISLTYKAYPLLNRYTVPARYRLTAINKAIGILKNFRKIQRKKPDAKKPYASKLMLTDSYLFKVNEKALRLSLGQGKFVFIPLTAHTVAAISGFTVRSINLTTCTLAIAFSKGIAPMEPAGLMGIDRNLNNVTTATLSGEIQRYDLSKATEPKLLYREVKSHFRRNDVRVAKRIQQKYGRKQRNKVQAILHNVSKQIVEKATKEHLGIVMENLTGIRKLYRKGNGQGKNYHALLNGWSYFELQRQIEYKTKWEGFPVIYVNPQRTSSTCAICGSPITECTERKVYCFQCDRIVDRDENAALNIVRAGVRFAPKGLLSEAMVKEPLQGVILTVDSSKLHPK